jgi:hypothetical protein
VKTHKLTIMLSGLAPATTIADLKSEVLSALNADVASDALDFMAMDPPQISVESEDDFELCRAMKERGKPTGAFEPLEPYKSLKESGLSGWEAIFLQIRDRSSGKHISILAVRLAVISLYNRPPMTNSMSRGLFFHCFAFVNTALKLLGLYEPHALDLQAIFYQSHTLFHQCMTKNYPKTRTERREQVLPKTRKLSILEDTALYFTTSSKQG